MGSRVDNEDCFSIEVDEKKMDDEELYRAVGRNSKKGAKKDLSKPSSSSSSSSSFVSGIDEEQGNASKLIRTSCTGEMKRSVPAFRCVIFSPGKCRKTRPRDGDEADLNDRMETSESLGISSALGIDLLIQENDDDDGTTSEVWVIEHVRRDSPLVHSPLETGDVVISVNGNDKVQQGFDHALSNWNQVLTILVHNPSPDAQYDLVETWVHSSAYRGEFETGTKRSISLLKRQLEAGNLWGLPIRLAANGDSIQVASGAARGLWKHALLGAGDVLISVGRLDATTILDESSCRALKRDLDKHRPMILQTRLGSRAGLALAAKMQKQSEEHRFLLDRMKQCRLYFGVVAVIGAVGAAIGLLLLSMAVAGNKSSDSSSDPARECVGEGCEMVQADGRPYRDVRGYDIVAEAKECPVFVSERHAKKLWSTIALESDDAYSGVTLDTKWEADPDAQSKWLDRGLAEHASIASFAAFTISLMTNQAPPDLVHDALQAAMDEWHHATTSFAWANQFRPDFHAAMQEPSGLPPTQHLFQTDLVPLARATVLEGCIGETLSALDLANQVDQETLPSSSTAATKRIALEEARHAALAWRTVRWVCQTDSKACETVEKEVLNVSTMDSLFDKRFPKASPRERKVWQETYTKLLPYAKGSTDGKDCERSATDAEEAGVLSNVASKIVEYCNCRDNSSHFVTRVA